jgi:succinate dehydrogenase / fumarate reductase, flavoprotein subunit
VISQHRTSRTSIASVLIIGSGAAGLRAAIAAHEAGAEVIVIGKSLRKDAHTVLAAGGINAVLATVDPEDTWQQHFADTLREGYFLADPRSVQIMAQEAPRAVQELADWGTEFARLSDGRLDQRFFGAHKYRRTCYAGDYTGRAMLYTLAEQVEQRGIPIHEYQYVSRLLVHEGQCIGAISFDLQSGQRTVYQADAVILAAGGHTRLWRRSSSRRDENTGDGMYLALQAGARLMDMEFVQFHPTGMVAPESMAGTLVTEAVRGEGGYLLNNQGERYMKNYDPERMELSTRDRVALANYTEIIEGRGGPNGGVFLDISHRGKDYILEKLPRMYRQFMEAQLLDISQSPMEVAPTAHYSMGGVIVEPETHATNVQGLYAVGEVTGGLHGANRLGGNSLAETVIFGRRAGEAAAEYSINLGAQLRSRQAIEAAHDELDSITRDGTEMARPLQRELRNIMWELCGVVRKEEHLRTALSRIEALKEAAEQVDVRPSSEGYQDLAVALDLRAALVSAEATVRCALERRESRGAHQRTDYPEMNPELNVNFITERDENGRLTVGQMPLHPIPDELKSWVEQDEALTLSGRLLE